MKNNYQQVKSKGGNQNLKWIRALALITVLALGVGLLGRSNQTVHAQSPPISTVYTFGQRISDIPQTVQNLPSTINSVQAANWGGMAIDGSGDVWQWDASSSPTAIAENGPTNAVSVGEGYFFSAAATSGGQLWTWGQENSKGDLCQGLNDGTNPTPTLVSSIKGAQEVSGGANHLLILLGDGHVKACGDNTYGQLGNGTYTSSSTPVRVFKLKDIQAISSGDTFSVALDTNDNVWDWGQNQFGELGDGTTSNSNVPVEVSLPGPVQEVFAGGSTGGNGQSIALLKDGSVYAWGNNKWGQLGNDSTINSSVPVQVDIPLGVTFTYVASGGQSSYALDSNGNLWAWGDNSKGQFGTGTTNSGSLTPVMIQSGWTQLSAVANKVVGG